MDRIDQILLPPVWKTCFSTLGWIWHAKNDLVILQKFWELGWPPPHFGKNSQKIPIFFLEVPPYLPYLPTWLTYLTDVPPDPPTWRTYLTYLLVFPPWPSYPTFIPHPPHWLSYRCIFLTGPSKIFLSIRLHSKSHQKVLSVRIYLPVGTKDFLGGNS